MLSYLEQCGAMLPPQSPSPAPPIHTVRHMNGTSVSDETRPSNVGVWLQSSTWSSCAKAMPIELSISVVYWWGSRRSGRSQEVCHCTLCAPLMLHSSPVSSKSPSHHCSMQLVHEVWPTMMSLVQGFRHRGTYM